MVFLSTLQIPFILYPFLIWVFVCLSSFLYAGHVRPFWKVFHTYKTHMICVIHTHNSCPAYKAIINWALSASSSLLLRAAISTIGCGGKKRAESRTPKKPKLNSPPEKLQCPLALTKKNWSKINLIYLRSTVPFLDHYHLQTISVYL